METDKVFKEATKFDTDKPRMDLIPTDAVREIAKVLTYGAQKYNARNWESNGGMKWGRLYAAIQRHLSDYWEGRDLDDETNLLHLAHAGCDILMLIAYQLRGIGMDDRMILAERPSWPEKEPGPPDPVGSSELEDIRSQYWDSIREIKPEAIGMYNNEMIVELSTPQSSQPLPFPSDTHF